MAASQTNKTSKVVLKFDITSDTTKNTTLNYINPAVTDSVLATQMLGVAGLQSHTLNTLSREQKYSVVE